MADVEKVECPVCGRLFKTSQINSHVNNCLNATESSDRPKRGNSEDRTESDCQPSKRQKTGGDQGSKHEISSPSVNPHGGRSTSIGPSLSKAWSFMKSPPASQKGKNIFTNQSNGHSATVSTTNDSNTDNNVNASNSTVDCATVAKAVSNDCDVSSEGKMLDTEKHKNQPDVKHSNMFSKKLTNGDRNVRQGLFVAEKATGTSSTLQNPSNKNLQNGRPQQKNANVPLPERLRPKTFTDYIGQNKVIGKNKLLRTLLESDRVPSMILWGPPGCGKTTLAKIIAVRCKETHNTKFVSLSATTAGIADVKEVVKIAKNDLKMFHRRTILFIDEIHRFNKLQQDTFLPFVEEGTISLIGATTENPSFQVNNALMSRCRVIILEKLVVSDVMKILQKALDHLGVTVVKEKDELDMSDDIDSIGGIEKDAVEMLANLCDGDARAALNCLQIAVDSCLLSTNSDTTMITSEHIKETLQRSHVQYDRTGEEHYNCASALQKSIRGSSPNGAIYWLSRMLEGGEDPRFIARRLVVTASEDIGLADPQALPLAIATFQACTMIGMPECGINLAHCTTYLARAPKSNESYQAMTKARDMIRNHQGPLPGVPLHLRNAATKLLKDMGCGKNYKYSAGGNDQEYLPEELKKVDFFSKTQHY